MSGLSQTLGYSPGPPSPWAFGPRAGWPWAATLGLHHPRPKPPALFLKHITPTSHPTSKSHGDFYRDLTNSIKCLYTYYPTINIYIFISTTNNNYFKFAESNMGPCLDVDTVGRALKMNFSSSCFSHLATTFLGFPP